VISNQRHVIVKRRRLYYVIPLAKLDAWKKSKSIPAWAIVIGESLEKIDFGSYVIRP
jgi:hypothetical protein